MNIVRAERKVIQVAGTELEVFMLPNGEYRYSQTSTTAALNRKEDDVRKYIERTNPDAAVDALTLQVGRTRVKGLTSTAVTEYWHWKAENGNKEAKALVKALTAEALERRADSAFGNTKTEAEYEQQTVKVRLELLNKLLQGTYKSVSERKVAGQYHPKLIDCPRELSPEERHILMCADYLILDQQCEDGGYQCAKEVLTAANSHLHRYGYQVVEQQLQPA